MSQLTPASTLGLSTIHLFTTLNFHLNYRENDRGDKVMNVISQVSSVFGRKEKCFPYKMCSRKISIFFLRIMYEYSSTHARNLTYTIILLYYTKVLLG